MKKVFQVIAILLAVGALAQSVSKAMAGANSSKEVSHDHSPGV